ncbi:DUF1570 domain-containing protein [Gimesia panareensis]|uniref:Uncharacterized protein n=1 Tax=Gimesia panareensis TaxID=2527978 RepID=A0A517ZZE2_9PLAN|nr:DUF1570 domain-containing protein [Gimesia panareensis]QDT24901.1 hypothetical protein Enr10x_01930 [Gimesia panareensis]QDU47846.1 hypothetical protein Pan110_01560 [Gimesia panareensis]
MPVPNQQSAPEHPGIASRVIQQTVRKTGLCLLIFSALILFSPRAGLAQNPRALEIYKKQYQGLQDQFQEKLKQLAEYCQQNQQSEGAQEIAALLKELNEFDPHSYTLPRDVQPELSVSLPQAERIWRLKLKILRKEQANDLFLFSRKVLHAGFPSFAYELILETAYHDPDHRSVRQILGYVRNGAEWMTPFEREMQKRKQKWHPKFGWLPASHIDRYERGERYVNGRWMSAAQEAEIRRDFRNAWEIKTEHFEIKTNHSLEMGVKLATEMEDFYRYFHQTFAGFFNTPEQLQKLFEGARNPFRRRNNNQQHVMHYYSTREEYIQRLQKEIPQIGLTHGIYLFGDRISHFYHRPDAEGDLGTLYHEATHQLFYETGFYRGNRQVGEKNHFWAIEGIACYMESFEKHGNKFRAGNPHHIRFNAARYRLLENQYYVPLEKFAAMGRTAFQSSPNISPNYSQASGLSHFFMHAHRGEYRDAFIKQMTELYSDDSRIRNNAQTLAELTGLSYQELDREYQAYSMALQKALDERTLSQQSQ